MLEQYLRIQNWIEERKEAVGERVEGQGLVEYALILVLVSIAAFVTLNALGGELSPAYTAVAQDLVVP